MGGYERGAWPCESRDRAICEMWNNGDHVADISARFRITERVVYSAVERASRRGVHVIRRNVDARTKERRKHSKHRANKVRLALEGRDPSNMYVTPRQAAELLDCPRSRVYSAIYQGHVPGIRRGGHWVIRLSFLLDWAGGR